jgi:hypothetical protein
MDNEHNLASTNFQPAISSLANTAAIEQAKKGLPKWQRYLMNVFIVVILLVTMAGLIGRLTSIGAIPACDAEQTRDTLSDLNKEKKFNASKYNFIKNVSTSDTETTCTANLALWGGGTVEYDYRIFKEGSTVKVQITDVRR